mmetsp:Transcript_10003/g.22372  ORF Transcript_10003/g.22372 Transcript_10003/m.22372 type:complete len:262 (+) Transcript_10003:93-878(+)
MRRAGALDLAGSKTRKDSDGLDRLLHELALIRRVHGSELLESTRHSLAGDVGLHLGSCALLLLLQKQLASGLRPLESLLGGSLQCHREVLLVLLDAGVDLCNHCLCLRLRLLGLCQPLVRLVELRDGVINICLDFLLPARHGLAKQRREEVQQTADEHHDVNDSGLWDVEVDREATAKLNLPKVQKPFFFCKGWGRCTQCGSRNGSCRSRGGTGVGRLCPSRCWQRNKTDLERTQGNGCSDHRCQEAGTPPSTGTDRHVAG